MGTDIHGVAQVRYPLKNSDGWKDVMQIEDDRNYFVFAVLGNVRNSVERPIVPIQDSRGLPGDFTVERDRYTHIEQRYPGGGYHSKKSVKCENGETRITTTYYSYGDVLTTTWMGDHSHGWVTLNEWYN